MIETTGPMIIFWLAEERRKAEESARAPQKAEDTHSSAIGSQTQSSASEREGAARSNVKDGSNDN